MESSREKTRFYWADNWLQRNGTFANRNSEQSPLAVPSSWEREFNTGAFGFVAVASYKGHILAMISISRERTNPKQKLHYLIQNYLLSLWLCLQM